MTELLSHPAERNQERVRLNDHLEEVADRASSLVDGSAETPYGNNLSDFVSILGNLHDFGKATRYFQEYLDTGTEDGPTHHAPLGALLTYYSLERLEYSSAECLAGYVAVAAHHGAIPNVADYTYKRTSWNQKRPIENQTQREVQSQVRDIDKSASDFAQETVKGVTDGSGSWQEFREGVIEESLFERIRGEVSPLGIDTDPTLIDEHLYDCLLRSWSTLVLADKTCAARLPEEFLIGSSLERDTLGRYVDRLGTDSGPASIRERELNRRRSEARDTALESVEPLAEEHPTVATLTLPTGMGKTLTGLDSALKLRDAVGGNRVIYAIPFTSIVDQVVDEVKRIYDVDERGAELTVHHHLSDTVVEPGEGATGERVLTDNDAEIAALLGESWRSGLVVTTFVQLFESLAGPSNRQSMKLPALEGSIVVLDEPQSLPHDWWVLVRRLVDILTDEYGASVVAMTATQPRIFEDDRTELVPNREEFFGKIERVNYHLDPSIWEYDGGEALSHAEASDRIRTSIEDGEDSLAICNTIDSAGQLTEALVENSSWTELGQLYHDLLDAGSASADELVREVDRGDPVLAHLSTRLRPADRQTLLQVIDALTQTETPVGVVSTQLVEAGVDLSFDRVYRDFAPIDSIVQAAGRCNRSFEDESGRVTTWWLGPPDGKSLSPGKAVYDRFGDSLLKLTRNTFEDLELDSDEEITESTISWNAVREYYRRLDEEKRVGKREWATHVDQAAGEDLRRLSLIEQRHSVEVAVCRTREELETAKQIVDDSISGDWQAVEELLSELQGTTVSLPVYDERDEETQRLETLPKLVEDEPDRRFLNARDIEKTSFFDASRGLVVPESTVERRFL